MFAGNQAILGEFREYLRRKGATLARLRSDWVDFESSEELVLLVPDPARPTELLLRVSPSLPSLWAGRTLEFSLAVKVGFPFRPPQLHCGSDPFHPNIAEDGRVCLSLVREDWSPAYTLGHVAEAVLSLFYHFDASDPLHPEAAALFRTDPAAFAERVRPHPQPTDNL